MFHSLPTMPPPVRFGKIYRFETPEKVDVWNAMFPLMRQFDDLGIGHTPTVNEAKTKGIILTNAEKPHRYVYECISKAHCSPTNTNEYSTGNGPVSNFFISTPDAQLDAFVEDSFQKLQSAVKQIYQK